MLYNSFGLGEQKSNSVVHTSSLSVKNDGARRKELASYIFLELMIRKLIQAVNTNNLCRLIILNLSFYALSVVDCVKVYQSCDINYHAYAC